MEMIQSSGNVFADLGSDAQEAENLKIRADLMISLTTFIEEKELTQKEAANLFDVSQPRISDLVRGKIQKFTIDTLVNMLATAGLRVRVNVVAA